MSDFETKNCQQVRDALFDYLSGDLGLPAVRMIEEHLSRCEACRAELDATREALRVLRENDPGARAPRELSERRRKRLLWLWTHPMMAWCVRYHHWVSLAVAILVLLLVGRKLYFLVFDRGPLPRAIEVEIIRKGDPRVIEPENHTP